MDIRLKTAMCCWEMHHGGMHWVLCMYTKMPNTSGCVCAHTKFALHVKSVLTKLLCEISGRKVEVSHSSVLLRPHSLSFWFLSKSEKRFDGDQKQETLFQRALARTFLLPKIHRLAGVQPFFSEYTQNVLVFGSMYLHVFQGRGLNKIELEFVFTSICLCMYTCLLWKWFCIHFCIWNEVNVPVCVSENSCISCDARMGICLKASDSFMFQRIFACKKFASAFLYVYTSALTPFEM